MRKAVRLRTPDRDASPQHLTCQLQDFYGSDIPTYAILSHRWEDEEVTFRGLTSSARPNKVGWVKIESTCRQAASDDFQWIWIDSCCIDKSSSAELSEAINSMFRWYRGSSVCYAYLSDVPTLQGTEWDDYTAFRDSLWFTRGWTLQELLAPQHVIFHDQNWEEIGTKGTLEQHIASATGIREIVNYERASVAQKMSWASKRITTREEDTAYCLLGLFGVNMPALHGEGKNAFRRLQLQIIEQSDDESIFAWTWRWNLGGGLLAPSPSAFEDSGDVEKAIFDDSRAPYSMTNKGLRMELPLVAQYTMPNVAARQFLAPLNCMRRKDLQDKKSLYPLAMWLRHVDRDQYVRISYGQLLPLLWNEGRARTATKHTLYIKRPEIPDIVTPSPYTFRIKFPVGHSYGFSMVKQFHKTRLNFIHSIAPGDSFTLTQGRMSTAGCLFKCQLNDSEMFVVIVDLWETQPVCT